MVVEWHEPEYGVAGDCFLLPQGLQFRVTNVLDMAPVAADVFYASTPDGGVTVYQGGGGTAGIVSNFLLVGHHANNTGDPVSGIAYALGYESETAFSAAFRKVMGCAPGQYRSRRDIDTYSLASRAPTYSR